MELAVHLRNADQAGGLGRLRENIRSFYEGRSLPNADWPERLTGANNRIYIGDEFCPSRLPHASGLDALLNLARQERLGVTLLTPPLPDSGIERCATLLDSLSEFCPDSEVVANDWGMLSFLKDEYPGFRPAAGRLLDKGFKDPRVSDPEALGSRSEEMKAVLNRSSFDGAAFREVLIGMGVVRLERDQFPYRLSLPAPIAGLETSIYFPFGYVTTGRVCWTSTFAIEKDRRFVPLDECSRPCEGTSMKLDHPDMKLPVFMNGNTVHYLHLPETLDSIVEEAGRAGTRLVYQGFAL
jgi:hypothetical protein